MEQTFNIALVDDHKILLDGLEALLSNNKAYKIKLKAECGETILSVDYIYDIDVIIMDINMKNKDGIQTLKELREMGFEGHCIFLSSYDDLKLVNEAMQLGAQGYVTKVSATQYLEEAIKKVLEGQSYYSPDIRERILNAFTKSDNDTTQSPIEQSMLRQLTEREIEVLKLIAMQYTSDEIGKKLYIAKSTVDTHRKNLIYKLKAKNAVGLGLFAERNGLI